MAQFNSLYFTLQFESLIAQAVLSAGIMYLEWRILKALLILWLNNRLSQIEMI